MVDKTADLAYCLKHFLLVRVHLGECTNLCQVDILAVTKRNDLIKCKYQWKRLRYDFGFFNVFTVFRNLLNNNSANM